MTKTMIALIVTLTTGCSALQNLGLTSKSTVEECQAAATKVVTQACAKIGDVRDKSQALVKTVEGAVEAAK